jgi:hypothetical protein
MFFGDIPRPARHGDYEPIDGGYSKHNGDGAFNHIITSGAWLLRAGDKPRISLSLRSARSGYAKPALLSGLGIEGQLRLAVTADSKTKWLDLFDSIDTFLSPSSARWKCSDKELGVTVELSAHPFIKPYGFAATTKTTADRNREVMLTWAFGRIGEKEGKAKAKHQTDSEWEEVEPKDGYALLNNPKLKYTQVYVGTASGKDQPAKGSSLILTDDNIAPAVDAKAENPCILIETRLQAKAHKASQSRFICVWGYKDYDKEAVVAAHKRLEFRPFADLEWVKQMKKDWFHHWIGKGLEPEKKFLAVRVDSNRFVDESVRFWSKQLRRVRIKTPDTRFDNVVNCTAALMRMQYEYPSFIHGLNYCKYGKINCGYYGPEAAGYHEEVASSLKFISGTQCPKGRQRYFTPAFALSAWAEEVNFYFVEQVWYHYRWTGDLEFLKVMWPSVRRALEHAISASDTDGDGLMTGFYEMWNGDTYARGAKCVLQTAMGWSALRAAAEMAAILEDKDHEPGCKGIRSIYIRDYTERYRMLMKRSEEQFNKHLWNREVGAWCSAEWNGDLRPRPANHEQNYHIWRGLGDPMRNYMAMRYVREHLQRKNSLGVIGEFNDLWWPILWSHHYVANGDTCSSVASACVAGDIDNYWPAMKSISESAYSSKDALIWQSTGSNTQEIEPPFIHSVVDGMFGVQPYFGENLLVLRPSFPSYWRHAEIELADASYKYTNTSDSVSLHVITPVKRKVRAELPVRARVENVTINGKTAKYKLETAVNCCRVVIESEADREHRFEIELAPIKPAVSGGTRALIGEKTEFVVKNAALRKVHDPQEKMHDISIKKASEGTFKASFVPVEAGKYTVFLELQSGDVSWFHPLDLGVRQPWKIVEKYIPGMGEGRPAVKSPSVDMKSKTLTFEIENNRQTRLSGPAIISVAGETSQQNIDIPTDAVAAVTVPLANVWNRLSPGSVPVQVKLAGRTETKEAVNWDIGKDKTAGFIKRLMSVDLKPYYNVTLHRLYGPEFEWRVDYTGCAIGVDWRHPMPLKDEKGYILTAPPIAQFVYHVLWEARSHHGPLRGQWEAPEINNPFETPVGVSFSTAGPKRENDLLALASTEPYEQLPSSAIISFENPVRLEKIYLLTANLTKILKCYYPGAEVIVHYENGDAQTFELVPPYTMSCMVQDVCPRAYAIEFGKLLNLRGPLMGREKPNVAVSDIVPDMSRKVRNIELRCVASETIFGIMGITVLQAR